MARVFRPPSADISPRLYVSEPDRAYPVTRLANRLFRYVKRGPVGQTVIRDADGAFTTVTYPEQTALDAATAVYLGGREYVVSEEEAAELTAAGYSVEET